MKMEITISIILLGVLVIFLNPTNLLMPDSLNLMLILGLIIGFLGFVSFIWKETATDEREATHIWKAGRLSFLVGVTVVVIGIIVQAMKHDIDPWLLYVLFAMVAAKLVSIIFQNIQN